MTAANAKGQLRISMDFVDGRDAARLLAERYPSGMRQELVIAIITAVAAALDYPHKQGLLYRDIKPANVMLTNFDDEGERRILVSDFGIARTVDDVSGLTTTNMTVGTVAYSAPEQLMGADNGRADQYSLAATAYHLLTGTPLFPRSNPPVVISHHLNTAPLALADTRPELAALDPVLAAALAKDPDDRFPRCSDFARALAEQTHSAGAPTPAASTTPVPVSRSAASTSEPSAAAMPKPAETQGPDSRRGRRQRRHRGACRRGDDRSAATRTRTPHLRQRCGRSTLLGNFESESDDDNDDIRHRCGTARCRRRRAEVHHQ